MNLSLHKKILIFGALITILSLPLLIVFEVDSYSFFEYIFTLDSDKGIVSSLFTIGVFLLGIAYILKVIKKG